MNVDAWRVAKVAQEIDQTGEYEVSRFPGYPVQEIVSSWFWKGGPIALNGLSAAFGVLAAVAMWSIARRLGCRDSLLIAVAMASVPIFFISSVTSKDYIWALAFVLLALWAAISGKPVFAGLLLGIAIGCRITSAAMLIPLALIVYGEDGSASRWRLLFRFAAVATVTALLTFLPVWLRYGWGLFAFYQNHNRPDLGTIAMRGTWEVWGGLGLLGLAVALGGMILQFWRPSDTASPSGRNPWIVPAIVIMVGVYLLAYLRLPDQAGYLLPIVPGVLLLCARFAPRRAFQFCCFCLIAAPWVDFSANSIKPGAVISDHQERKRAMRDVTRFIAFAEETLPGRNVVVVGAWQPVITVLAPDEQTHNHYTYTIAAPELRRVLESGDGVAYASEPIREFNYRVTGLDLARFGATDMRKLRIAMNR